MGMLSLPVNIVKTSIGSKRFPLLAIAIVSVVAMLLGGAVFVARGSWAHEAISAESKLQGCCGEEPAIPRRMIGTYYMTEDGFRFTLISRNLLPRPSVFARRRGLRLSRFFVQ